MTRHPAAARATTLVVVLASLVLVGPGTPPAAAEACDGVWVVVDARAAGGTITTRCAAGDPPTGVAALERAGHAWTFVPRIPGMICTIDARPDPCNGAPADAYWSYWYAAAGGAWTYASVGAGSRDPAPGSVEGWRFGDGSAPPGVPPPAPAPAPDPAPAPAPEPAPPSPEPEPAPPSPTRTPEPAPEPPSSSGTDEGSAGSPEAAAEAPEGDAPDRDDLRDTPGSSTDADGDADAGGTEDPERATGAPVEPAAPGPRDTDTAEEPADTDATDDLLDPALAAERTDADGSLPLGTVVAAGLLAGIGLLTGWQRRRRDGATS